MEHDERDGLRTHWRAAPFDERRTDLHRHPGRQQPAARLVRQAGVDADGRVQLGVGGPQHHRHGSAGRQSGDIHPLGIDGVRVHDASREGGKNRWLAVAALLMPGLEPVPAAPFVGGLGLLGVEHQKRVAIGQLVHASGGGEVFGSLGAAMQQHQQRDWLAGVPAGHVELVVAPPVSAAESAGEPSSRRVWAARRRRGRRPP